MIGALVKVVRNFEREKQEMTRSFDKKVRELEIRLDEKIDDVKEHDAKKRGNVYERIDQERKDADDRFVRQDMCRVLHGHLKEATEGVAHSVERLLDRNGVD
jgi:hypothetical protein